MPKDGAYDLVIAGGGTAGCVLAGRIAEQGVHPKTGEKLKIAMIEAGPYWRGELKPGYGHPERRRMITNVAHTRTREYLWPYRVTGTGKMVGGSSVHFGGNAWLPGELDLQAWVSETGVDWSWDTFKLAVDEARQMFTIQEPPEGIYSKGTRMFREAARKLGHDVQPTPMAAKNCLYCGYCGGGYVCRYDSKGTALVYAAMAEKHGVEIITEAEIERVIIEKNGGAPQAKGVVYKKGGETHEARSEKVIVSCGVAGTPLLFYRSGYGSSDLLGDRLMARNDNVGQHVTGDCSFALGALFDDPIKKTQWGASGACNFFVNDAQADGSYRLRLKDSYDNRIGFPDRVALGEFAPMFGRELKRYVKDGLVREGGISVMVQNIKSVRGRIDPNGQVHFEGDPKVIEKRWNEGVELATEVFQKMGAKRISKRRPRFRRLGHEQGTARAGESRANSVVNSDFESHDVENLFVVDGSAIPRNTVSLAAGPVMAVSCFAWRRIVNNHFA